MTNQIFNAVLSGSRWSVRSDVVRKMAVSNFSGISPAQKGDMSKLEVINGIAILKIDGILSYRAEDGGYFGWLGYDTYESIGKNFDSLVNDPAILGIILDFNSPGGEVSGCSDLADKIFNARGKKKFGIVARTGGFMCSAAYWIGSGCEKVYVSASATVGSIGTMVMFDSDTDENIVVSDLSPNKDPDPKTAAGEAQLKAELNSLAVVFIEAVARNRGVAKEKVVQDFGGGASFVGVEAVTVGLADSLASIEDILLTMKTEDHSMAGKPAALTPEEEAQNQQAAAVAQAVAAERGRVAALQAAFAGTKCAADLNTFINEGKTIEEANAYLVEKLKEAPADPAAATPAANVNPQDFIDESKVVEGIEPGVTSQLTEKQRAALYAKRAANRRYKVKV